MQGLLLILILAVIVLLICFLYQRKVNQKELARISDMITDIMDGRQPVSLSEAEETLLSKIESQLMRLKDINDNYSYNMKSERDNTQKRITEIAHQLRTPLLNIRTYIHMLRDTGISQEKQIQYLEAIASSEQKLSFLVESFVKMSRLENHLIQIKYSSVDISQTVLDTVTQVYNKAVGKDIEIKIEQTGEIICSHDSNWLGEAVYNILDNSIKYSPEHSKILIALKKNEMFTKIIVRDFGKGIERGEENRIFSRYYRGKNVECEEGYGIGLYLSREIISQHGGIIKVHRENPGLCTIIYLENK